MHRAYAFLNVKSVDGERRVITGKATTPTPDRMGDIVEPLGVKFKNPIPLLLYHNSQKPVGWVKFQKPTEDGIEFEAKLPTIEEPGTVRDRIEEAWTSIKTGLLAGVSIGFRSLEEAFNKETNGFRFLKTEVLELSLVAIPAQPDARIETIKSLDIGRPADVGTTVDVRSQTTPAAVGTVRVVHSTRQGQSMKKTYGEQIKDCENTITKKTARMDELLAKASDEGRTLDTNEQVEYDELDGDVKDQNAHIVRLRAAEERSKFTAKAVVATDPQTAAQSRTGSSIIQLDDNREKGIGFARGVMAKMASFLEMRRGNFVSSVEIAKAWWPSDQGVHRHLEAAMQMKAAVPAATTQAATYAGFLVYADNLTSEFIEFLRPQTIIGKFGMNGVPSLRRVPFNVRIPRATAGMTGYWVGEGKGKPVTSATGDTVTLTYTKVAAIAVITQELARFSSPSAEAWVRDELAKAVVVKIDTSFIDPALAASSYVNPASITNGLTALTSAGTSADNVRTDVQNLLEQFILQNLDPTDLVLIMPNTLAMVLSIMVNTLGQREFPQMTINGGSLLGIPVIASQHAASGASFGNMVIAVKANDIALADDGRVNVDVSSEASLEMDNAPTLDSTVPTAASLVSMFQTNSLAVRAEREIHWAKLRSTAVVYMDDVNWGAVGSPV